MKPIYLGSLYSENDVEDIWNDIPWIRVAPRDECWMNNYNLEYTYGEGRGMRTYQPVELTSFVQSILDDVNDRIGSDLDVCFINGYRDSKDQLGWHSDDSPEVSSDHPIAVVSFGAEREIWTRLIGSTGMVPPQDRYLLEHGSVFVMPSGFQEVCQHRIPKHSADCGKRISLTFRKYKS